MDSARVVLTGSYDLPLVVASIFIAILSAGALLDLAGRVRISRGNARIGWLSAAAVAVGSGIWTTHFIGTLALRLPVIVLYDWPTELISLCAAGIASWAVLFVVSRDTLTVWQALIGSSITGSAVIVTHYTGMQAMRLPAMCDYSQQGAWLAVLLAICISFAALQTSFVFRGSAGWSWYKVSTAMIVGGAFAVMHYVAMAAVGFVEMPPDGVNLTHAVLVSEPVVLSIAAVTAGLLGVVFLGCAADRHFSKRLRALHERAARERERADAAARADNRARADFLGNMSHEIRTPMNGVIGMSELLLDTPLDCMQRAYAESIRDSGNALLTVINDILDFSKMDANELELELLEVDLRDTFEDVTRLLSAQAHAKGLEVTAQIDPRLPRLVTADAGRVRQMLLSLAGSAIRFTPAGEVALELKVLESDSRGTRVRCEVRDTGFGIDTSTARRTGGTGLRDSIVRRLADLMGGESGAQSTHGVGSTSWFTAWFGRAVQVPHLFTEHPAALTGQRVILVDDNATNRKVLMGQLLQCGVDPVSAASAGEALMLMRQAAAAGRPFDAALLDQQMPDCDGAELGRIIINDDTLDSTRLILLTSSGQRGEGQRYADIGFAGYLLKPVVQRDLTECLMLALASEAETWRTHAQPIITRHALRAQRAHFDNHNPHTCLETYLPDPSTSKPACAQEPPVDWERLLGSFGGDTAFARKLVELFVTNGTALLASIAEALRRGDYATACSAAEELKGATANMGAQAANNAAALCEAAARSRDIRLASALAEKLANEMQLTIAYLQFKLA